MENINYKVSVIIPTYNRDCEMLVRAVKSVMEQSYKNIEIVIVDDNAKPEHIKIRREVEKAVKSLNDKRITFIQNEVNLGSAGSRNAGVRAANGEFITFLDDDDVYLPNKVLNQLQKMIEDDADYSITDIDLYYTDEKLAESRKRSFIVKTDAKSLLTYHLLYVLAGTDSFMFKKEYFLKIGGFGGIDFGDDFYLFKAAIDGGGKFSYLPRCDFKAYVHREESGLSIGESKIKGENEVYAFKKRFFNQLSLRQRRYIRMRHLLVLAYAYKRQKQFLKFIGYGFHAFLVSPISSLKLLFGLKKKG